MATVLNPMNTHADLNPHMITAHRLRTLYLVVIETIDNFITAFSQKGTKLVGQGGFLFQKYKFSSKGQTV
jgi:hypothetical protein